MAIEICWMWYWQWLFHRAQLNRFHRFVTLLTKNSVSTHACVWSENWFTKKWKKKTKKLLKIVWHLLGSMLTISDIIFQFKFIGQCTIYLRKKSIQSKLGTTTQITFKCAHIFFRLCYESIMDLIMNMNFSLAVSVINS